MEAEAEGIREESTATFRPHKQGTCLALVWIDFSIRSECLHCAYLTEVGSSLIGVSNVCLQPQMIETQNCQIIKLSDSFGKLSRNT